MTVIIYIYLVGGFKHIFFKIIKTTNHIYIYIYGGWLLIPEGKPFGKALGWAHGSGSGLNESTVGI